MIQTAIQTAIWFIVVTSSPTTVMQFTDAQAACAYQKSKQGAELFAQYYPYFGACNESSCSQAPWIKSKCAETKSVKTETVSVEGE